MIIYFMIEYKNEIYFKNSTSAHHQHDIKTVCIEPYKLKQIQK